MGLGLVALACFTLEGKQKGDGYVRGYYSGDTKEYLRSCIRLRSLRGRLYFYVFVGDQDGLGLGQLRWLASACP